MYSYIACINKNLVTLSHSKVYVIEKVLLRMQKIVVITNQVYWHRNWNTLHLGLTFMSSYPTEKQNKFTKIVAERK